jgi:hypothetical protein
MSVKGLGSNVKKHIFLVQKLTFIFSIWIVLVLNALISTETMSSEWFCDTEKSFAEGNVFFSCGLGIAKTREEACKKAIKSAHDEFKYICDNSYHCKGREKIVKPNKIKVTIKNGLFECLRAFEYKILNIKAKEETKEETKEDLKNSQIKIRNKIEELRKVNKKLKRYKQLDRIEKEIQKRKRALSSLKKDQKNKKSFKVPTNFWGKIIDWKLLGKKWGGSLVGLGWLTDPFYEETLVSLELTYRTYFLKNFSYNFYIGLGGSFLYSGKTKSSEIIDCYISCSSEPEKNPIIEKGSLTDFSLFIPFRYKRLELTLETGSLKFDFNLHSWYYDSRWRRRSDSFKEKYNYQGFGIRYFFGKGRNSMAYKKRSFKDNNFHYILFAIGY